jgi:hypothetical protein
LKKAFKILLLFSSLYVSGQSHPELNDIKGVEIFLFEGECRNQNSIFSLNEEERNDIGSQYRLLKEIPAVFSPDYINSDLCKLKDTPFLNKTDIDSFNWNTGELILSDTGKGKLSQLEYYYYFGVPFTMKVKGQAILNAWFWSMASSQICTRVYGLIRPESNSIILKFDHRLGMGINPLLEKEGIARLIQLQQE